MQLDHHLETMVETYTVQLIYSPLPIYQLTIHNVLNVKEPKI